MWQSEAAFRRCPPSSILLPPRKAFEAIIKEFSRASLTAPVQDIRKLINPVASVCSPVCTHTLQGRPRHKALLDCQRGCYFTGMKCFGHGLLCFAWRTGLAICSSYYPAEGLRSCTTAVKRGERTQSGAAPHFFIFKKLM